MRMVKHLFLTAGVGLVALIMAALTPASAQMPKPWQMNFQPPATPVMERLYAFHTLLVVIITVISVFVLGLLLFAIVRFREARNPVPSRTTHHTLVEVVWTVVPVLILVVIAIPSLRILYYSDRVESADMTIKAIGHQWYWSYEYPDSGDLSISAKSAALGTPISSGATRAYQTYYRDPDPSFCAAPSGNTWNVTNGVSISW